MAQSPTYLLMSTEEDGFARFGFWLQDSAGKRRLSAGHVDWLIGDLYDEIFSQEVGSGTTQNIEVNQNRLWTIGTKTLNFSHDVFPLLLSCPIRHLIKLISMLLPAGKVVP